MSEIIIGVLALAAVVFGTSAAAKLRGRGSYDGYVAGLRESGLIPARRLTMTAAILAGGEVLVAAAAIVAGGFLLTAPPAAGLTAPVLASAMPASSVLASTVLAGAVVLTGALSAGIAAVLRRGTRARCACFGSASSRPLGAVHLTRNLALLAVFAAGLLASVLDRHGAAISGSLVAIAGGGITGLLVVHLEDVADLFGAPPAASPPATRTAGARGRRPR